MPRKTKGATCNLAAANTHHTTVTNETGASACRRGLKAAGRPPMHNSHGVEENFPVWEMPVRFVGTPLGDIHLALRRDDSGPAHRCIHTTTIVCASPATA